jgi:hypothetical protein
MSNYISLYVDDKKFICSELTKMTDVNNQNFNSKLVNLFGKENFQTDSWGVDISDLVKINKSSLLAEEVDFLSLISGKSRDKSSNYELCIAFSFTHQDIKKRFRNLISADLTDLTKRLWHENEYFLKRKHLYFFLSIWMDAMKKAIHEKKSIVFCTWV